MAGCGNQSYGGYGAFRHSPDDIFGSIFSNPAYFAEMSRMFEGSGLRFDEDFFKQMFGGNVTFRVYTFPGGQGTFFRQNVHSGNAYSDEISSGAVEVPSKKPGFFDRLSARITRKIGGFIMQRLFGVDVEAMEKQRLDREIVLELSSNEAAKGTEKIVSIERDGKKKSLKVKIPAGTVENARIRLKGMGNQSGDVRGDLYLRVKIKP